MFQFVYNDIDFAHKFDENFAPSPDYDKHFHDFYEMYFFISGHADYTVEEERHMLVPGDVLLIQPGEHHYVTFIDADTPYERYVLKFQSYLIPDFVHRRFSARSAFYHSPVGVKELFERLDMLYKNFEGEELHLLYSNAVAEIILNICKTAAPEKVSLADNKMTPIVQYINENLRLPLTILDLCDKFHFSQSYICKEFRAYMKTPIMKYVRSKKIMAAHQQIERGEKPTKVAEMFGYVDYSTFYRTYTSVMGFPPSRQTQKPIRQK